MILLLELIFTNLIQGWQVDFLLQTLLTCQWLLRGLLVKNTRAEQHSSVVSQPWLPKLPRDSGYRRAGYLVSLTYILSRKWLSKSKCVLLEYHNIYGQELMSKVDGTPPFLPSQVPPTHQPFHSAYTLFSLLSQVTGFGLNQKAITSDD